MEIKNYKLEKEISFDKKAQTEEFVLGNEIPLIDKLTNSTGYSVLHYLIIMINCFVLFTNGIHMNLLNSTFIPFQKYYDLTELELGLISSSMFVAVGFGSFLTTLNFFNKDRKNMIIVCTFCIFVLNFMLGLITKLLVFTVLRSFIGVAIGIIVPLINNLQCEILPIKNRSFSLVITSLFFGLGSIFLNFVILYVMPNYEIEKLHTVFIIVSMPILLFSILMFFFLEESPRHLILHNNEKGFIILEKLLNISLNEEQKETIRKQILEGCNKKIEAKFSSLFEKQFRSITIILICIWLFNSFIANGGAISMSLVMKYLEELKTNNGIKRQVSDNTDIIKQQILVYLIGCPGSIISGLMTEIKIFGRKMTIFTGFFGIGIFCFLAILNSNNFALYLGLSSLCLSLTFSASNSYSCEVYPTKIRNLAIGFLCTCTGVTGFSSQFISILLFKFHYLGQYYVSIIVCVIACMLTYMLPYDTYGMPLDIEVENENHKNKTIQLISITQEIKENSL